MNCCSKLSFYWDLAGDEPYRNWLKLANNWRNLWSRIGKNQSRQKHETQVKLIRKWILFIKIRKISNYKTSRNKNRTPRTKRNMDSLLATDGNTMEFPEQGDSQGFSQPRAREEAGRLQKSLRNLKGLLTQQSTNAMIKLFISNWSLLTIIQLSQLLKSDMLKALSITITGARPVS